MDDFFHGQLDVAGPDVAGLGKKDGQRATVS